MERSGEASASTLNDRGRDAPASGLEQHDALRAAGGRRSGPGGFALLRGGVADDRRLEALVESADRGVDEEGEGRSLGAAAEEVAVLVVGDDAALDLDLEDVAYGVVTLELRGAV